ncbi:tetratricopeptide repeat protein [Amycolatopsis thermalba]
MLGVLLLRANTHVHVHELVEALWDNDVDPSHAARKLQIYVSRVRSFLDKHSVPACVHTAQRGYRLEIDRDLVDYHRFRKLVTDSRALRKVDRKRSVEKLRAAVGCWRGDMFDDLRGDWLDELRDDHTRNDLLPAYYALFDAELDDDGHETVAARTRDLLQTYDLDETLARQHLTALAVVDGAGSAANFHSQFTDRLRRKHDRKPGPEFQEAWRRIVAAQASTARMGRPEPPCTLPRRVPGFHGRADLLDRLDEWLLHGEMSAVIALDGAGGIGKTTLATHWAHTRKDYFPDGVLYFDLNGYGNDEPVAPATVMRTFLEALNVRPADRSPDLGALLRSALAGRRILVVLDNVRDRRHLGDLLTVTAPSPVLITSRQKITLPEGRSFTVPLMSESDSSLLLQRRLADLVPEADLATVPQLAKLCDGLPMALRIAAEHVARRPGVPLAVLTAQLERERARLLDAGADDGSTTLRAIFTWSCDALSPELDHFFQVLGLHPSARISLPAAAAMAGSTVATAERLLERLITAHLVQQDSGDTYRLHDLLHLYAAQRAGERCDREERVLALRRMLDWYLGSVLAAMEHVAPFLRDIPPQPLLAGVRPLQFDDAAVALEWCVRERPQVIAVSRFAAADGHPGHAWRLIGAFSEVLNRFGDPRRLSGLYTLAVDAAIRAGERDGEAGGLNNLGVNHFHLGEYDAAAAYFGRAMKLVREGDVMAEAMALYNLANCHLERGNHEKAIELHERSLALSEAIDDLDGQARVYHRLGDLYQRGGRFETADRHYRHALALRSGSGEAREQGDTYAKLAGLALVRGDFAGAIADAEAALAIYRRTRTDRRLAEPWSVLSEAHRRLGNLGSAVTAAEEAVAACRAANDIPAEMRATRLLAEAREANGNWAEAITDWSTVAALADTLGEHDQAGAARSAIERLESAVPGPRRGSPRPAPSRDGYRDVVRGLPPQGGDPWEGHHVQ